MFYTAIVTTPPSLLHFVYRSPLQSGNQIPPALSPSPLLRTPSAALPCSPYHSFYHHFNSYYSHSTACNTTHNHLITPSLQTTTKLIPLYHLAATTPLSLVFLPQTVPDPSLLLQSLTTASHRLLHPFDLHLKPTSLHPVYIATISCSESATKSMAELCRLITESPTEFWVGFECIGRCFVCQIGSCILMWVPSLQIKLQQLK